MNGRKRRGGTRATQRRRATYAPIVNAGYATCQRCGQPIQPGQKWHIGHKVALAAGGTDHPSNLGLEHAECNLRGSASPVPEPDPETVTFDW